MIRSLLCQTAGRLFLIGKYIRGARTCELFFDGMPKVTIHCRQGHAIHSFGKSYAVRVGYSKDI